MANVLFKQGTQTALDKLRTDKGATNGTFYLTSDSRRLYIGTADLQHVKRQTISIQAKSRTFFICISL